MSSRPHQTSNEEDHRPGLGELALKEERQRRVSLTDATTVIGTPAESEKRERERDGSIDFNSGKDQVPNSGAKPLTGVRLVLLMIAMVCSISHCT